MTNARKQRLVGIGLGSIGVLFLFLATTLLTTNKNLLIGLGLCGGCFVVAGMRELNRTAVPSSGIRQSDMTKWS